MIPVPQGPPGLPPWLSSGLALVRVLWVHSCSICLLLVHWLGRVVLIVRFPLCSFDSIRENADHVRELAESLKFRSDIDSDPMSG